MTVSSSTNQALFAGNGTTTVFPLPFRFFSNGDIAAYLIDSATGGTSPLVLGTHYSLAGAGEPEVDGSPLSVLTMFSAPEIGQGLYVERIMDLTQPTDIVNQGRFFPTIHELVFDRLTMLIQQANANTQGSIRVAIGDPEPNRLPPSMQRANLLLGFDSLGQPIVVAPSSNSASDLAMQLANSSNNILGAAMIGRGVQIVQNKAELRLLSQSTPSNTAFVLNHEGTSGGGGGAYYLDLSDLTSADNNVTIIVAGDGGRWKLVHQGELNVEQFGALPVPGRDNFNQLSAAVAFCHANKIKLKAGYGTFEYSSTLDLSYPTLVLHGSGFRNTVFKFTGSGRAARADGDRPNNGIYSFDLDLSDFTIEGNPNATDLLRVRINHSRISRLNFREASSENGCGLRIEGCVAGYFESITMSTNTQLMTSRPANGILIGADPSLPGSPRATLNTLNSPCIEGAFGDGIVLNACDMLTIVGGTSENNGGNGLTELAGCQMNTMIGFDCEVNSGFADFFLAGQSTSLKNCGSTRYTYIDNSARLTKIEGGWYDKVEVGEGAVSVELNKLKVRFFGGAVGIVTNNNPWLSTRDIFDVQANAFTFISKAASVIPLTGSGMIYTNNNIRDEAILINPNDGTVTQLVYRRSAGAVGLMNPATGYILLNPGDGFAISYTGSPILTLVPGGSNYQ